MKPRTVVALLLLPMLAGPLVSVQAQISQAEAVALIAELAAAQTPPADVVSRLLDEGLTLEEILALLAPHVNNVQVEELLMALVEYGLPAEDAAAMVVSMHSTESTQNKLVELADAGISREVGSRLLVVLTAHSDSRARMEVLTNELGMAPQEAAQLLIFLTTRPQPRDILNAMIAINIQAPTAAALLVANNATMDADTVLEAMLDQGLSLAQATEIITTTEATATFAQPLAEIVAQTFTPSNFSNDALTGAAGGGVSTSQ